MIRLDPNKVRPFRSEWNVSQYISSRKFRGMGSVLPAPDSEDHPDHLRPEDFVTEEE